jgi:Xaa-Pro aminopeptidase
MPTVMTGLSAPTLALERRHAQLRAVMAAQQVDVLLVTSLPNILYLTNFNGTAAIAIVEHDAVRLLTDSRYVTVVSERQASSAACPDMVLEQVTGSYDASVVELLARRPRSVGFEAQHLTVSRFDWLTRSLAQAGAGPTLTPTESLVERLRVIKDEHELSALDEAGRRLSFVATEAFAAVKAGRTERAVAADIDHSLRSAGFERPAFETIVASGPNSALPHARPSERILDECDLVVLDFGGVYASYCADLTRTVVVGHATPRAREVHQAVLAAQRRAIAAVAPGASRFDIDAAARSSLREAGMGEAFGHGTGHGLGVEIHEDPRLVQRRPGVDTRDEAVATNMVFTIEPGAYFPGWGGVRIEDDVVVTVDGARLLTTVTTELLEL